MREFTLPYTDRSGRMSEKSINKWHVESVGLPNQGKVCDYLAAVLIDIKQNEKSSILSEIKQRQIGRINRGSKETVNGFS